MSQKVESRFETPDLENTFYINSASLRTIYFFILKKVIFHKNVDM